MRPTPIKISLSDKEFTIKPLTLGQIRKIENSLRDPDLAEIDKSFNVIQIALERDYPEDSANLLNFELSMSEVGPMVKDILTVGGMIMVEAGEMQAPQLTTGTTSMEN